MRQGVVYLNKERVGIITELSSNEYKFRYDDEYFNDPSKPSISLTLTKQQQEYTSHYLFPFFANTGGDFRSTTASFRQDYCRLMKKMILVFY